MPEQNKFKTSNRNYVCMYFNIDKNDTIIRTL